MTATVVAPAFLSVPPRAGSYGDMVVDLAALYGRPLDPEQQLAVDAFCSHDTQGHWAAFENCVVEPRQNGKTDGIIMPVVLTDLFLFEPDKIIWTAHRVSALKETFAGLQPVFDCAELSRRIRSVTDSDDDRSVELMNGARLEFMARSAGQGRALHAKHIVNDEALFLEASSMGGFIPTMLTRGNSRITYGSSAAKPESDLLRGLVSRGRSLTDPALAYVEWCAGGSWLEPGCATRPCTHALGVDGCAMDDEERWRRGNPALGRRITIEKMRSVRRAMPPEEFGREIMGWHDPELATADPDRIPLAAWNACADPASSPVGRVVFSVDMSPDGSVCSIGVAGKREDGRTHLGVVDSRYGTDWVAGRLEDLLAKHDTACGVVWQPTAPIGALAGRFDGLNLVPMTGAEMAQACGALKDDVTNDRVRHQGAAVLDAAFSSAERRVGVEGAWTWGRRKSAGDISPMVAVTEALWGLTGAGGGSPSVYSF